MHPGFNLCIAWTRTPREIRGVAAFVWLRQRGDRCPRIGREKPFSERLTLRKLMRGRLEVRSWKPLVRNGLDALSADSDGRRSEVR